MMPGVGDTIGTLYGLLSEAALTRQDKPAVVDGEITLTYGCLIHQVDALVHKLKIMGVQRGDAVGMLLPNGAEFVTGFFSIAKLGAIVVPLNVRYKKMEIVQILRDCDSNFLITSEGFEDLIQGVVEELSTELELLFLDKGDAGQSTVERDHELSEGEVAAEDGRPEDQVLYLFSSGSTGVPKRIARSNANLVFELKSLARTLGFDDRDKFLGVAPFSHVNGLVRSMLAALGTGATLHTLAAFKRQIVAELIEQEGISVFIGVPPMFQALAETNYPQPPDLSSLRLCFSSSAPMPLPINQLFAEKYGFWVRQLYGSTETGSISANSGDDTQESMGSVGVPIEGVEISILRDDHTPAAQAETGEIVVRSPAAFAGYQLPIDNADCFIHGYFLTGDLGMIDERGNLYITGRKKFFINRGGYKVNPWEIEAVLQVHPKVKEVAVIGVPERSGNERVKAIVVPHISCSKQEIVEHCAKQLASFKVPSLVEFRESLPTTPTGKLLRSKLN